ncbi:helix-turn-helix domain-containing protein [Parenemella sanctibonifatiensis]|uniref:DNA-binding protein n=1 Tax=Parenemella sanctibonifatiensis TaxID=2016505 RepID=A0A255DYZ4_9ACTN|nr:helix-turn-helix domain-containing protein [Parenemella sanctibonifatiensis]OYN84021.1 DNA-binding protein [Parenemella sanctibonifatiensis]
MSVASSRGAATGEPRTYLPPARAEEEAFHAVLEGLKEAPDERPALVGPHGEVTPIPAEAFEPMVQVLEAMTHGLAVHVAPLNAQLTTQEAANYLGVSRPTLVKLLEEGAIPFTRPRRHRYVRLADLIAYADRQRDIRSAALDEMALDAEQDGLYERLDGPPPAMR